MNTLNILLIVFSALTGVFSETDGKKDQQESTVSHCILNRWRTWIYLFDVIKDGVLSHADLEKARKTFTELHKLGEDKELREEMFTKWWEDIILWNRENLPMDEWIALQSNALMKNKQKLVEKVRKGEELLNSYIDVDDDGYISQKEEIVFLMALGRTNKKEDEDFFKDFDPENKGVYLKNMTDHWVKYFTDEDCDQANDINHKDPMTEFDIRVRCFLKVCK